MILNYIQNQLYSFLSNNTCSKTSKIIPKHDGASCFIILPEILLKQFSKSQDSVLKGKQKFCVSFPSI